jgi:hypothetical protein
VGSQINVSKFLVKLPFTANQIQHANVRAFGYNKTDCRAAIYRSRDRKVAIRLFGPITTDINDGPSICGVSNKTTVRQHSRKTSSEDTLSHACTSTHGLLYIIACCYIGVHGPPYVRVQTQVIDWRCCLRRPCIQCIPEV